MRDQSFRTSPSERGIALLITSVMLVFIIPMIGLSVDVGILYAVRTKLSMACDAGALVGARSLSRGLDDAAQQASAKAVAKQYILLNFPNGYFGTPAPVPPDPTIDESIANQRSVTVSASVNVPLYFLRWLGGSFTAVSSTATATRRDVNVVIVMDRSGSLALSGSCASLQQAAVNFVNRFANGRDNVALVTFATSSLADFPIANNFQSASPNVITILNSLNCTGATNSAEGLWLGYSQLVALNQPNALNVLLFFTDGYPTAITSTFPIKVSSTCTDHSAKLGVLTVGFSPGAPLIPVIPIGLYYQVGQTQPMGLDQTLAPTSASARQNCSYAANVQTIAADVTYIPNTDSYGNAMNTNYQPVTYYDGNGNINVDAWSVQNASVNAADSAGLRIRQGASVAGIGGGISGIRVYSIGLGNFGGVPDDFLERVSNDPRATNFDNSKPAGFYIYAPTAADLSDAFGQIAAEILHISR